MSIPKRINRAIIFAAILMVSVLLDNRVDIDDIAETASETATANSHNCMLWGAISESFPDSVIYNQLVLSPQSLKNLSMTQNTDGWGIADYPDYGDSADVARGGTRAYYDTLFDYHVETLAANNPKIIAAHVRLCDSGCCCHECDSIPDPHPFTREKNGRWWTFAHNGNVSKSLLYDLIGEDYLLLNPPTGSGIPECDPSDTSLIVDSELLFIYILKQIEANDWHPLRGLTEAIVTIFVIFLPKPENLNT